MIIAIPSVTNYISESRKGAYITTAKEYITGARNIVNSGKQPIYSTDTTYYIPSTCIPLENGGESPYGKWVHAYAVTVFDGNGYDYYWTSVDESGHGIYLTHQNLLNTEVILTDVKEFNTKIGVGDRSKILLMDKNTCKIDEANAITPDLIIPEKGRIEDRNITQLEPDYTNTLKIGETSWDTSTYLGYTLDRDKIEEIKIEKTNIPQNALALDEIANTGVDVSQQQNGSIIMWVTDTDANGMYELHIGQENGVVANGNSSYLFCNFSYIIKIDVTNLKTNNVTNMDDMFHWSGNFDGPLLTINGLSRWNTSNVESMDDMFCSWAIDKSTRDIINSWNTPKVMNKDNVFEACK